MKLRMDQCGIVSDLFEGYALDEMLRKEAIDIWLKHIYDVLWLILGGEVSEVGLYDLSADLDTISFDWGCKTVNISEVDSSSFFPFILQTVQSMREAVLTTFVFTFQTIFSKTIDTPQQGFTFILSIYFIFLSKSRFDDGCNGLAVSDFFKESIQFMLAW